MHSDISDLFSHIICLVSSLADCTNISSGTVRKSGLPMIARLHPQARLLHHLNQQHRRRLLPQHQHQLPPPLLLLQLLLRPIPTVRRRRHNVARRLHALMDCAALNGV